MAAWPEDCDGMFASWPARQVVLWCGRGPGTSCPDVSFDSSPRKWSGATDASTAQWPCPSGHTIFTSGQPRDGAQVWAFSLTTLQFARKATRNKKGLRQFQPKKFELIDVDLSWSWRCLWTGWGGSGTPLSCHVRCHLWGATWRGSLWERDLAVPPSCACKWDAMIDVAVYGGGVLWGDSVVACVSDTDLCSLPHPYLTWHCWYRCSQLLVIQ